MNKVNWDIRYLKLAKYISGWSKDTSTGTGAIIVDNDNRLVSIGYNGFPQGANDNIDSRYERPQKYLYTEHAERNAIYNSAKNGVKLEGLKMYLMWFPCADCARAIIQSGITQLICFEPEQNNKKWSDHFTISKELLTECGVEIKFIDRSHI